MNPNLIDRLLRRAEREDDEGKALLREAVNELSALRSRIEIRAGKEVMPSPKPQKKD